MSEEISVLEQKLGQMKKEEAHKHFVDKMTEWGTEQTQFVCDMCKENYWVKKENGIAISARCACESWDAEQRNCLKCGALVGYHLYVHDYGYEGKTYHKQLYVLDYIAEYIDYKTPEKCSCENCFNLKAIRLEQEIRHAKASLNSWMNELQKHQKIVIESEIKIKELETRLNEAKQSWRPKAVQ